jgi:superfamily II DNA or RNA helicase
MFDSSSPNRLSAPPAPLTQFGPWKLRYSSDLDNLVQDFFTPALAAAKFYDRVVGYFRLSALAEVGRSLEPFYTSGKKMRLVASVELSQTEIDAIQNGLNLRAAREQALERFIDQATQNKNQRPDFGDPIGLLTGMLEEGLLDIYLSPGRIDGGPALYHEKIGVIEDHDGNFVTFEGSPNETGAALGLGKNIESFPIHRSWIEGEAPHALAAREAVDGLFSTPPRRNVEVLRFPEAIAESVIKIYPPQLPRNYRLKRPKSSSVRNSDAEGVNLEKITPSIPGGFSLHNYQSDAVRGWLDNNGRGRFEMATGTGKTVTALAAAVQTAEQCERNGESLLIVVCVPDGPLVEQWSEEADKFGFKPVTSQQSGWRKKFSNELLLLKHQSKACGFVVVTFDSALADKKHFLSSVEKHQSGVENSRARVMLIADEAHGLGSESRKNLLLERYDYRLALTATFSRHFDEEGTDLLLKYFEGHRTVVSISDAINKYGTLVPYRYHPIFVELTEEENKHYEKLSLEIAKMYAMKEGSTWLDFEDRAFKKLLERAEILKHAEGKVRAFEELLEKLEQTKYMLVYAAEGTAPLAKDVRQDDALLSVLEEAGVRAERFNGDLPHAARMHLQKELNEGNCDCLVAMKCLDEGIDIPEARIAFFLASTTNPRQYVQRRGRVLRKSKNSLSNKDNADLYDFIVTPPRLRSSGKRFEIERKIVSRELLRALELAETSMNSGQAIGIMAPYMDDYGLHDLISDRSGEEI